MGIKKIYTSATFEDTLELRIQNTLNPSLVNPFAIEAGSTVEVHFPGISPAPSVVLSTANSGEITINDTNASTISYVGSPAKAALLNVGLNQSVDVVVTQGISGKVIAFELVKYADISNLAAP